MRPRSHFRWYVHTSKDRLRKNTIILHWTQFMFSLLPVSWSSDRFPKYYTRPRVHILFFVFVFLHALLLFVLFIFTVVPAIVSLVVTFHVAKSADIGIPNSFLISLVKTQRYLSRRRDRTLRWFFRGTLRWIRGRKKGCQLNYGFLIPRCALRIFCVCECLQHVSFSTWRGRRHHRGPFGWHRAGDH